MREEEVRSEKEKERKKNNKSGREIVIQSESGINKKRNKKKHR